MVIAFYVDEMNFRGIANSTYNYALLSKKYLKNNSIIFFNKNNKSNKQEVVNKFKKKFETIGVSNFKEIDNYKSIYKIDFIYTQKGGEKDTWLSNEIKTLVHVVYPQKLKEIHGYRYAYISEWLSTKFSNNKIPYVPYVVEMDKTKNNLKKKLKIKKKQIILGCYGGESSFDLKFVHDVILKIVKIRKDISFLFLNINSFCKHPRIIFLKGTTNESYKRKFVNTCDGMIYGRSLGESFGLACGEFALQRKEIISYRYNRHESHIFNILEKNNLKYGSFNELYNILINFYPKKTKKKNYSKYEIYKPKKVINMFNDVFLTQNRRLNLSIIDYFVNFTNFNRMYYLYLKHKLYNHYYNLFESKFINLKD